MLSPSLKNYFSAPFLLRQSVMLPLQLSSLHARRFSAFSELLLLEDETRAINMLAIRSYWVSFRLRLSLSQSNLLMSGRYVSFQAALHFASMANLSWRSLFKMAISIRPDPRWKSPLSLRLDLRLENGLFRSLVNVLLQYSRQRKCTVDVRLMSCAMQATI